MGLCFAFTLSFPTCPLSLHTQGHAGLSFFHACVSSYLRFRVLRSCGYDGLGVRRFMRTEPVLPVSHLLLGIDAWLSSGPHGFVWVRLEYGRWWSGTCDKNTKKSLSLLLMCIVGESELDYFMHSSMMRVIHRDADIVMRVAMTTTKRSSCSWPSTFTQLH